MLQLCFSEAVGYFNIWTFGVTNALNTINFVKQENKYILYIAGKTPLITAGIERKQ